MSITRRSVALAGATALLSGAAVVAAAPVASADLPDDVRTSPAWDAPMAFPFDGEHQMRFGALSVCSLPEDGSWGPRVSANAYDLDRIPGSFDFSASMFPFNSATVEWEILDSGLTGSQTVHTTGNEVGTAPEFTGRGEVLLSITVSRSALPTMAPGSVAPFLSDTHTERFLVPDNADCG